MTQLLAARLLSIHASCHSRQHNEQGQEGISWEIHIIFQTQIHWNC